MSNTIYHKMNGKLNRNVISYSLFEKYLYSKKRKKHISIRTWCDDVYDAQYYGHIKSIKNIDSNFEIKFKHRKGYRYYFRRSRRKNWGNL